MLGVSRQPMRFISVDLPEPDGPMMATYSPRSIVDRHPAQGVDLLVAHHVGLPEVVGFDECHGNGYERARPPVSLWRVRTGISYRLLAAA